MVACPKCNGELSLPEGADQESIFDCPHCQASYPISEARLTLGSDGPLLFDLDGNDELGLASEEDDAAADANAELSVADLDAGDTETGDLETGEPDTGELAIGDAIEDDAEELDLGLAPVDDATGDIDGDEADSSDDADGLNPLLGGAAALGALGAVAKGVDSLGGLVGDKLGDAASGITDAASGAVDAAGGVIGSATDAVTGLPGAVADKASGALDGVKDVVDNGVDSVGSLLGGAKDAGEDLVAAGGDAIDSASDTLGSGVDAVKDAVDLDSSDVDLDAAELLGGEVGENVDASAAESVPSTDFGAGLEPLDESAELEPIEDVELELGLEDVDGTLDDIEAAVTEEAPEPVEVAKADFEIEELAAEEVESIDDLEFTPLSETTDAEIEGEFDDVGETTADSVNVAAASLESPTAELPDVELPSAELSAEFPDTELTDVPDVEAPDVELPNAELPEIELPEVEADDDLDLGLDSDGDDSDANDPAAAESGGLNPLVGGAAALGALGAAAKGVEVVKGMMGDAAEGVTDVASDAVGAVSNTIGAAGEAVGDLADGGADLVGNATNSAKDAVSDLAGKVSGTVEGVELDGVGLDGADVEGVDELSDLGFDEPEMDMPDLGGARELDLDGVEDVVDFEADDDIEVDFSQAIDDEPPAEDLSQAAEAVLASNNDDIVGVEDVSDSLVDDAITMEPVADDQPVEVVKPFDIEPSPDQVPAKNYRPGIPSGGGGIVSSLLKFGVGGLLGLLVAQAGMWWIGRIDPLSLAGKLPPAVGFMAPNELRNPYSGETARNVPRIEANKPPALNEPDDLPADDPNEFGSADNQGFEDVGELKQPATSDFGTPIENTPIENTTVDNGGEFGSDFGSDFDGASADGEFGSESSTGGDFAPESTTTADSDNDVTELFGSDADTTFGGTEPVAPAPTFGLIAKQNVHRNDLSGALGEANRAWEALLAATTAKAPREERKALMFGFYDAVANMGQTAIHVDADAEPVVSQMQFFMQGLGKYKVTMGKAVARRVAESTSNGVFLSGTVSNQQLLGSGYQRFQVTLLGDSPRTFDVVAPDTSLAVNGSSVYILGTYLSNPSEELAGFDAAVDAVVWSDQVISL